MGNIKIVSTNVRGLRDPLKRRAVFRHLHSTYSDYFVAMQDTHSVAGDESVWQAEWGARIVMSHGATCHQGGVAFLIPVRFAGCVKAMNTDNDRIAMIQVEDSGVKYCIMTVYAPTSNFRSKQTTFLNDVGNLLQQVHDKQNLVLCGDFNMHLSSKDVNSNSVPKSSGETLKKTLDRFELLDVWRDRYPDVAGFTWKREGGRQQSRIDYFFISETLVRNRGIDRLELVPSVRSDHHMLVLNIELHDEKKGPGIWKFNNSLLENEEYVQRIKGEIRKARRGEECYSGASSTGILIETLLGNVRGITIETSKRLARKLREEESEALSALVRHIRRMQQGFDEQLEYERCRDKWERLHDRKARRAMLLSKANWAEAGEKPTAYFLRLQQRHSAAKAITKLVRDDGCAIYRNADILKECARHYAALYSSRHGQRQHENDDLFCNIGNPRLTDDEKLACEGLITGKECITALKSMANNKTPGPSGFTKEFFVHFWDEIGELIVSYINDAFHDGEFFFTQRRGYVTLLPKKGDQTRLCNKRPIVLLDTIYKIVAKVLAIRMSNVIDKLIGSDQTGFIKGRNIGENIRLMADVLHYCDKQDIPGILMNLDFAAAFDSIEHSFMFRTLSEFNFGENFKRWVQVLYQNSELSIVNNGFTSEWFPSTRGIKQGCPFSGILFVLAVEIFACKLRKSESIHGLVINKVEVKISQYADDTSIFVKDEESAEGAIGLLHKFGESSGLRLNLDKSDFIWLGPKCTSTDMICQVLPKNTFKSLGIIFSTVKDFRYDNLQPRIRRMRAVMNMWKERDVSIKGKITLAKSLLLSQLTYIASAFVFPQETVRCLEKEINAFLWGGRAPKVKRAVLQQGIKDGGLGATDVACFLKSLRVKWLTLAILKENAKWRQLFQARLGPFGVNDLLMTSLDRDTVDRLGLPEFYSNSLLDTQAIKSPMRTDDSSHIMGQVLWYNKNIRIGGRPIFYATLHEEGIRRIRDVIHNGAAVRPPATLSRLDQYKYWCVIHAIPKTWREVLRSSRTCRAKEEANRTTPKIKVCDDIVDMHQAKTKDYYNALMPGKTSARCCMKWAKSGYDFTEKKWQEIFTLPYKCCKSSKLQSQQYRVLHRYVPTQKFLFIRQISESPKCKFCKDVDTIEHFLVYCGRVHRLWKQLFRSLRQGTKGSIPVRAETVIFGCPDLPPVVNYIVLLGKQYILRQKLWGEGFISINLFRQFVQQQYEEDKYTATKNEQLDTFECKWNGFTPSVWCMN